MEQAKPIGCGIGPSIRSKFRTVVDALRSHAQTTPTATAYRFLADGKQVSWECTYLELHQAASRFATQIRTRYPSAKPYVLMYPTGPDYLVAIWGCLYAEVTAIPLDVPRPNRHCTRLISVCQHAKPDYVFTTSTILETRPLLQEVFARFELQPASTDITTVCHIDTLDIQSPSPKLDSVAHLQYTSGSTTKPKGVMITHGNLVHNLSVLAQIAEDRVDHSFVGWLPFHHDMGLVGTVFLPIWMGHTYTFMSPETFVMSPLRWLQAISDYRATLSPAPNFGYEWCVKRIAPEHCKTLDLSSWRVAFNGAERIDPGTLQRFSEKFQHIGFRPQSWFPCYGLAEGTLIVTGGPPQREPTVQCFDSIALRNGVTLPTEKTTGQTLVGCGRAADDAQLIIVSPETRISQPPGHTGEIWLRSPSVAAGYLNSPLATAEAFQAYEKSTGDGPFLRTGDLGFLWQNELFVLGRLNDLIIHNGQNIAPEDIELTIESAHPAIGAGRAVAFAVDTEQSQCRIVAVAEISTADDVQEIEVKVRHALAQQNDITIDELLLVQGRQIPRTPNGKKRRAACRQMFESGQLKGTQS